LQCDNGNGDQTQETLDNHGGLGSIEQAAADQLLRELDESGALSRAKAAGNVPANILRRYERINQSFAWKKHMQRMLASIVKRYQAWDRPHRLNEIMHGIGGLVRPGELIRNDYNCLVYADASGSIGPEEVGRFVDVLIRAPKEIKMHVFSFDTQIYEWPDWKKAGDIPGGGGTYFGAIVEHADDKEARGFTPDAVIVLTDGWAEDPTPREPRRWLWISTDQLLSRQSGTWVKMPPQGAKPSQKRRLR
jgi:predicted metal-dependent peptidase